MDIILTRVLDAVHEHHALHGLPPSVREIAAAVGVSVSTVHRALEGLESRGEIERLPGVARGIRLISSQLPDARARLLETAQDFELAAAHEAEFVVDDNGEEEWCGEDDPLAGETASETAHPLVAHAIRCALFRGYAHGIRRALDAKALRHE